MKNPEYAVFIQVVNQIIYMLVSHDQGPAEVDPE